LPALLTPSRLIVLDVLRSDLPGALLKIPAQALSFKAVSLAHPAQNFKTRLAGKTELSLNVPFGKPNPLFALRPADSLSATPGLHAPDGSFPSLPGANKGSFSST
jgi:hypothetical protein